MLLPSVFRPTDLAGLMLWLDATAISGLVDGDPVATWSDLSGNGNHATQATAGLRPLYKTSILNGRPVVRFDGAGDYLAVFFTLAQPEAIFLVGQWRAPSDGQTLFDGNGANTMRVLANGVTPVYRMLASGGDFTTSTPVTTGTFQVIYALFSGSSSALRINGGSADVGNAGFGAGGGIVLGALGDPGSLSSAVDLAEVILYNREPSNAERQRVERYLSRKYGITVS